MAHLKDGTTKAQNTPPAWLPVGASIGRVVNDWANRGDLVVYLGPGAGGPAPACFTPSLAEIEINTDVAFGATTDPKTIGDLATRKNQYKYPKAIGAIMHESFHARFTRWDLQAAAKALKSDELAALHALEESRIEKFGLRSMPKNRAFLRSCALEIVIDDMHEGVKSLTSVSGVAQMAALVLARIDAGVIDRVDVASLAPMIESLLGEELLANLREIWLEFQEHDEHANPLPLYDLAREWAKLVAEASEEAGESPDDDGGCEYPGGEGEDEGEGEGGEPGTGKGKGKSKGDYEVIVQELLEALEDAAGDAAINAQSELDDQELSDDYREEADMRTRYNQEVQKNADIAKQIFSRGTGPGSGEATASRLIESRVPTSQERIAAVQVANALKKAKYRDRSETTVSTVIPPGRLRTRTLVQGTAMKTKNPMAVVEPWRQTKRKHTDDPELRIGVMVDISGSMGAAMQPMASAAWILSEATKRVQGKAAMVYYGSSVFPTLKPGQSMDQVKVYTAPDGTEEFDTAFRVLDGALNLTPGTGARLLVVVSDGHYTPAQTKAAKDAVNKCANAGVGVLWITFQRDGGVIQSYIGNKPGTKLVEVLTKDFTAAAMEIGAAATRVLTAAGR